jgi:hypothetical protein
MMDLHPAAFRMAEDFPAARRPASTPTRSAASIMGASRMDFRPAAARVLAEGSTAEGAEAGTLEEEGTDEHQAGDADNSTYGDANDA